ncbi:MAG: PepSY domain-containing protein [Treponema sp.]|nr:PepSY domain-containing protein [Treponema sp.]
MKNIFAITFVLMIFVMGNAQVQGQTISALEARDLAISMVGGGMVTELKLVQDPAEGLVYHVVVVNNYIRYDVLINAGTGEVFRLSTGAIQPVAPTTTASPGTATQDNRTQRIRRNPFRPRVSRAEAVEIGYAFLASRGFPNASFRRHSGIDFEWGRWAWELYFWDVGVEIELYIDMHTGDVTNFDIERTGRGW